MTGSSTVRAGRDEMLAAAAETARTTLAVHADEVDKNAVFPVESVAALAHTGLLSAALPQRFGGAGLSAADLAEVGRALGRGCGSTAMIWAMHQVQVACVAKHATGSTTLEGLPAVLAAGDGLIASVTTELGVGGNLRQSRTACAAHGDRVTVVKETPTVSYAQMADAFLITARRNPDAAPGEQVLVLAGKDDATLENVGEWNTMGMRGTRSPGCRITVDVPETQVLPVPFAEIAARTMVPLSHILWSAVWIGIAEEAAGRAVRMLRRSRRSQGPERGTDLRPAAIGERLGLLDGLLKLVADGYDRLALDPDGEPSADFAIEINNLKLAASVETVKVAETALEICGMAGYQEHTSLSVSRMLRDLYSARLMISNSRLLETNATSMLMRRYG
ncbi:acyl-CoA dehydrogenase family protein [Streptomyces sp. NPDC001339]|uniref:acyl-CoA dehydrogenase family protein n=1 Tax=Streptomyces sp. NPDC001339 TaxID=3364563 RepID=UPI0036CB586F